MANLEYFKNLYTLFTSNKPRKEEVEFAVANTTSIIKKDKEESSYLDGSIVTAQFFR